MDSIVTKYHQFCTICNKPADCTHHMIPGTYGRPLSEKDGLKIPLCNECHNMFHGARPSGWECDVHHCPKLEKTVKQQAQLAWEKEYYKSKLDMLTGQAVGEDPARDAFLQRYGKSFL